MRSDPTPAFLAAMQAGSRKPRQLLVFHFESGDVYLSDQPITLGGVTYRPLVEDWGELSEAANPEEPSAEIRQMSITLWNGGSVPFSDHFLVEDPEDVEVDLYQWFKGLADSDKALIDRFVVQDPIEYDEASRLLNLDLVSLIAGYEAPMGERLSLADWPGAKESDVGRGLPLIIGSPGEVSSLCGKTAPSATLKGSILKNSTTINVNESLGDLGFLGAGILQLDEERIRYTSRDGDTFFGLTRGYGGTVAAAHMDGATVIQLITDHKYVLSSNPLTSITNVKVGGYPAPAGIYTVNPAGSLIQFNQKPYALQFSRSADQVEVDFDNVGPDNSAYQPFYAFDADRRASSALIDQSHRVLDLVQVNVNPDVGQIVRAWLEVEHWATKFYLSDYASVWVDGIGIMGNLCRPSSNDNLVLEAEVDIDHPHTHRTGDIHTHDFDNPSYWADVSYHAHPLQGSATEITVPPTGISLPYTQYMYTDGSVTYKYVYYYWTPPGDTINSSYIRVVASLYGASLALMEGMTEKVYWDSNEKVSIDQKIPLGSSIGTIRFKFIGDGVVGGKVVIHSADLFITYAADLEPSRSSVTPQLGSSGANDNAYNTNQSDDVDELLTANRSVDMLTKETPTRTIVDTFDITDYLTPTWNWFTGRRVKIIYYGSAETPKLFITHMRMVVEVRRRERVYSDEVSGEVVGLSSNRPDQVIEYILTEKAGLPAERIDTASFAAAGTRFAALGYTVDGLLDADLSAREALKKVCLQTRARLIWTAGKAKLLVREIQDDWSFDAEIMPENYALKSLSARRQRVDALVNVIDLQYGRDWLSGAADARGYTGSVTVRHNSSINQHGQRSDPSRWLFDLVVNPAQAASLAEFYLNWLATPSTFYELLLYLDNFLLEKGDHLNLTSSGFGKLRKVPLEVLAVERQFGSGKNRSINRLRVIAENWRYFLHQIMLQDSVLVMSALHAVLGKYVDLADHVHATDMVKALLKLGLSEIIPVADELTMEWLMNHQLSDSVVGSDNLAAHLEITLSDTVKVMESLKLWKDIGYGQSGYGRNGYGGVTTWYGEREEMLTIGDVLEMLLGVQLLDGVTATETLMFSDGYGSPKFGGYGVSPYGY